MTLTSTALRAASCTLAALALATAAPPAFAAPLSDAAALARFKANYKMLVETNTTHSAGDCTLAANRLAGVLKKAGFPAADIQVVVPPGHPKEGSLTAVLRGSDPAAKALLLLGHIDVVEAKRSDWARDPFKLVEEGGYFYARGASDDKAMVSVNVDTLLRLREQGFKPRRDIKLAATCGEEIFSSFPGALDGFDDLLKNHRPLVEAGMALNEGAAGRLGPDGKHLALEIQAGEKLYQDFTLTVTGPGGHSARPHPDDVIQQLVQAIDKVDNYRFPLNILPVARGTFEAMGKMTPGPLGEALTTAAQPNPSPEALEVLSRQPNYVGMLRTTCIATQVNAGHAPNALAQKAQANVNCRILPGEQPAAVMAALKTAIGNDKVAVDYVTPPGTGSEAPPLTPELMAVVKKNAEALWPGVPVLPVLSVGATDGSFGNAAGIPTYGLSGIFREQGADGVHGLNERVPVQSLYDARTFLFGVVQDLSR